MEIKAKKLTSWTQKSEGLLNYKKAEPVYFETRWGIHTFFMKFPIDVAIIDDNNETVTLKESLQPNRIFIWNPRHKKVLEFPAGQIQRLGLKIGSSVNLNLT